ncbi:hypothetical protein PsorP6_009883 [Peronosclerospora sorghi]|uniref:Uncharacterized protein n=1 Tax=Peronosclerospora sorghi TaxID=230839 RepID=A0ACC0W025_9STRA|nr:hypothetical protein PsorP6_009883 [Peronosclerospora sorghi]
MNARPKTKLSIRLALRLNYIQHQHLLWGMQGRGLTQGSWILRWTVMCTGNERGPSVDISVGFASFTSITGSLEEVKKYLVARFRKKASIAYLVDLDEAKAEVNRSFGLC